MPRAVFMDVRRKIGTLLDSELADISSRRMKRLHRLAGRLEAVMEKAAALREQAEKILIECRDFRHPRDPQFS